MFFHAKCKCGDSTCTHTCTQYVCMGGYLYHQRQRYGRAVQQHFCNDRQPGRRQGYSNCWSGRAGYDYLYAIGGLLIECAHNGKSAAGGYIRRQIIMCCGNDNHTKRHLHYGRMELAIAHSGYHQQRGCGDRAYYRYNYHTLYIAYGLLPGYTGDGGDAPYYHHGHSSIMCGYYYYFIRYGYGRKLEQQQPGYSYRRRYRYSIGRVGRYGYYYVYHGAIVYIYPDGNGGTTAHSLHADRRRQLLRG